MEMGNLGSDAWEKGSMHSGREREQEEKTSLSEVRKSLLGMCLWGRSDQH